MFTDLLWIIIQG